jgi:hypothetical protein
MAKERAVVRGVAFEAGRGSKLFEPKIGFKDFESR